MSLSDLASLGSFVSGVAVLASLVFLFFQMWQMTEQVNQTEKNQRAIIHQGRIAQSSDRLPGQIDGHTHHRNPNVRIRPKADVRRDPARVYFRLVLSTMPSQPTELF